ncbi:STAS domain-containing protein [Actinopolymorpha pittospori]|uniref:STAS domain-containing protein n=1 Tax=Actinopolymorpha pittospori TaxID=648752 RepID=UPI0031ED4FD9
MTLQWHNEKQRGITILHLTGYLGESAIDRFAGAVGWVLAHGTGPIVLDLADLHGWSDEGQAAVVDAATRLASHERILVICGLHRVPEPKAPGNFGPPITVYPDVGAALTDLCQTASQDRPPRRQPTNRVP